MLRYKFDKHLNVALQAFVSFIFEIDECRLILGLCMHSYFIVATLTKEEHYSL